MPNDHANDDGAKLIANFLRQIAGSDWSRKELLELARVVASGERRVRFDPDFEPESDEPMDLSGSSP